MERVVNLFADTQQWLYESLVQPVVFALGFGNFLAEAFDATGWLLIGLLQILVMLVLFGPLQRWRPVEAVTDHAAVRTDVLYTLIHRLGLFRLVLFFTLMPWLDELISHIRIAGFPTFHLDDLWPGVTDRALLSFLLYLIVLDFFDYWIHRGQHQIAWWWRLHALHHSQRQMTMWSDNRNHLLDDLIRDVLLVTLAQLIGVAPGQFIAIVAFTQLSESLQHANLRLSFGRWGEGLWISPRFHRRHHSIGIGHESPVQPSGTASGQAQVKLGGCNFGVLLPWWDMLFGTADFKLRYEPTGIRDQVEQGRDYGRGFWAQQWLGLKRLTGRA